MNSRRTFIKMGSVAGLAAITADSLSACSAVKSDPGMRKKRLGAIQSVAGLSIEQLHERYRKELLNRFIPAMDNLCIDPEYGGFMCDVNILTRKINNSNKRTWYQGRGIWVYSFLYNHIDKNPRYIAIAKQAVDFILKLRPTDDSFWRSGYTKDGKTLDAAGDIYGDLFVAEGLAEYAKATGSKEYLNIAKDIIFKCLEKYDRPDYRYDISYAPGTPKIDGPRVLGHWMIFLSLSTQILTQGPDPKIEKLADRCIEAIMTSHLNKEYQILNEVINHDLTLPDNEYANFAVIGHGIETLGFVMAEAVRRKDAELFKTANEAFKRHVEVAADKLYGGYFEILYNANTYTWAPSKSAWCQQEVSVGALLSIEHTAADWAKTCFDEGDAYMLDKMRCPEYAFWTFGGGRKMTDPSKNTIEHYHLPRYLMRNVLALERIISRQGKPSGFLSV